MGSFRTDRERSATESEDLQMPSHLSYADLVIRLPALKRDLVVWSLESPSFRKRLLADAKSTIEQEMGFRFPQHVTVEVLEETSEQIFLIIPRNPCQNQKLALRLEDLGLGGDLEAVAAWVLGAEGSPIEPSGRLRGVEARLVARAWKDERFKRALQTDPHKVIEEEVGWPLPEGVRIRVLETSSETIQIVLPACIEGSCSDFGDSRRKTLPHPRYPWWLAALRRVSVRVFSWGAPRLRGSRGNPRPPRRDSTQEGEEP